MPGITFLPLTLSGGRSPSWLAPDLNQRITELECGRLRIPNEQVWKLRPKTTGLSNGQNDFGNQTSRIQHPFIQNIPCRKPAPCHTLWVPGNTKIHNIIVPEAGEKNQNRKLQYGQVSMYEGPALGAQTIPDSLWQKEVPLELSRRKILTGQVRGTEGATFWLQPTCWWPGRMTDCAEGTERAGRVQRSPTTCQYRAVLTVTVWWAQLVR